MTRQAYLLVYNDEVGTREQVRDFIDGVPEILNWRYDIPHTFYLVSECSAEELADLLLGFAGKQGRFLIAEVTGNKQGWLPRRTWELLNHKQPAQSVAPVGRQPRAFGSSAGSTQGSAHREGHGQ